MSSLTKQLVTKRKRRDRNQNRARKAKMSRHSTLSAVELFAGFGEPGKPAPKA
jgi:hypothetical protein